jgi:hypothetical protein
VDETVGLLTLDLPVFVRFTLAVALLPAVTLPTFSLVAGTEIVAVPLTPVPLMGN